MSAKPVPQTPALQSFNRIWEARSRQAERPQDPVQAVRRQAMSRFLRLGLPTLRDESWHYTNLRVLAQRAFEEPRASPGPTPGPRSWVDDAHQWPTVRLVNGLSDSTEFTGLPAGLTVRSLREMERSDNALLASLLPPLSDLEPQRWTLLNSALFEDGLHVRITGQCPTPLLILHAGTSAGGRDSAAQELVNSRVIIDAQPGSSAIIVEHHVGGADEGVFSNSVTNVNAGAGSTLEHFRIFSGTETATHVDQLQARVGSQAALRQHTVCLGGNLVRADLDATLVADGAHLDSFSLLSGNASRHADCVNTVTHAAPHTTSRQTARVIASGRSRAIFNSKVIVSPGAQKADSHQSCRGLLLSPTAEIDTRPQLEIHANDVKCAHGATTGRLDPDMLFYLLSRGLDRGTAQSLLVFAFLADVLTGMSLPGVRTSIESKLIEQLPDAQLLRQFR